VKFVVDTKQGTSGSHCGAGVETVQHLIRIWIAVGPWVSPFPATLGPILALGKPRTRCLSPGQ
jgi:hypothetical protein